MRWVVTIPTGWLLYMPDLCLEQKEKYSTLYEGIERLPERHRMVVELHYFHGFTYQEIVFVLGRKSKGGIHKVMKEAIEALAKFLE